LILLSSVTNTDYIMQLEVNDIDFISRGEVNNVDFIMPAEVTCIIIFAEVTEQVNVFYELRYIIMVSFPYFDK